jgi:phosphotriesterase-related protein
LSPSRGSKPHILSKLRRRNVSNSIPSGKVQTVLGPIAPEEVGPTSIHDHLLLDFTFAFKPPDEATEYFKAFEPVTMKNLGWVCYDPFRNLDNLLTIDEDSAIAEVSLFKRAGGMTITDTTSVGIRRDPLALARISRATGLNVVMGSGYYIDRLHPEGMDGKSEEEIVDEIVGDFSSGVGSTGVRSGIIGELGCSWPMTANERKVLRAGARAQEKTGASIAVHPGRDKTGPFEALGILEEAGADLSRVVIAHMDRTIHDMDTVLRLARRGCYLEWDFFGWEISQFSMSDMDMLNDAQRLGFVRALAAEGYIERVLMAQDMFGKHRRVEYGGHGFAHILENIVPRMPDYGLSQEDVETILVRNPTRILTLL